MRTIFFISILAVVFAHAEFTPWELKLRAYIKGLPNDVGALLQRTDECNHWSGEEPYDKERAKEIAAAMKKINCASIDADTKKIIEKYKADPKIVEKIKNFSTL